MDVTTSPDFHSMFLEYIAIGAEQKLAEVNTSDKIAQDEECHAAVLHVLEFALDAPAALDPALAILENLSTQMERVGRWTEWVPYLEKGIALSRST